MVLSASPLDSSKTVSLLLDEIASDLSQEHYQLRIKKLLLYVCTGTWENDRPQLERTSLQPLLQNLFESCLTLEQLQQQLNQVVATLNKSAEYTIVANTIISRFHAVYAELQQGQTTIANPSSYQALAQRLEQQPECIRIKKLLLLTCRSTWDNNAHRLARLKTVDLVQELHQIAPTLEGLQTTLNQVARALSKPEEYTIIAETITTLFQTLYQETHHGTAQAEPPDSPPVVRSPSQRVQSQIQPRFCPPVETDATEQATGMLLQANNRNAHLAIPQPAVPQAPAKPTAKVLSIVQADKTQDLFNLRLEIMQDANPLKAKILLFSLLHEPFQWQAEQDGLLRTHDLDELLRILFLSYRLYSEVASKLRAMAKQLASEEYAQTAEAVLRAIESFYVEEQLPSIRPVPTMQTILSETTAMKANPKEITIPDRH